MGTSTQIKTGGITKTKLAIATLAAVLAGGAALAVAPLTRKVAAGCDSYL